MKLENRLTRRRVLWTAGVAIAGTALAACSQPSPTSNSAPEVVTKEVTKIVPATVVVTKQVEKVVEVTPTAVPGLVTPQGRQLPTDAAPLDQQVLYGIVAEPKHLDVVRDIYNANVVLNWGGEPMLRLDENQKIVPALAESYKAGPNAEYFDFVLRKDAKWSDGTPITPDDWVFTLQHAADPKLDNPWAWFYYSIKGVQAYKEGKGTAEGVGVEKIDDRTVRVHGEGPAPQIPALMTYQASVPAPKARAEKDPLHWADTVDGYVSSGPFKLVKWDHNKRLEWEINPYYNGPHKPGLQRIVQLIGTTGPTMNAWLSKEIDIFSGLTPPDLAQVRANPQLNALLRFFNNFQTSYLAFDTMRPPLNNLKLRQALSHAIDRATLSTQVLNGTTVPAYSLLPPGFPAYNADLKSIQDFNVEKAKSLLSEAGYPDGKDSSGKQLTLDLFSNGVETDLQFVQEQWQRLLGIKVNLQVLEGGVWGQRRAEHAMMIYRGPYEYDYLDPSNFLSLFKSNSDKGSPRHSWKNAEYDQLVTDAGHEVDDAKRTALYQQAEKILVSDVGAAFLGHQVIFQVWWPYIVGIHPDKTGNVVYRYLDISNFQMYIRNDVNDFRKPH